MNSTDAKAAAIFFAEWLLPLHHVNMRHGIRYLDGTARESYWGDIASRTGGLQELGSAGSTVPALLEALGHYWGPESSLLRLLPQLAKLYGAVSSTVEAPANEQALPEFLYPLS